MRTRRSIPFFLTVGVTFGFCPQGALAIPLTFTFSGTGTGIAGNTPFTDAAFTIYVFAETDDNSFSGGVVRTAYSPATIEIVGVGQGDFTEGKEVFNNTERNVLGLNNDIALDLIDLGPDDVFIGYWLDTPFGPVFDPHPFAVSQFHDIGSTLGLITFSDIYDVTFVVMPEPATLSLLALGGLSLLRRRR